MLLGGLTSGGPYPLGAMNRTGCPQNSTCSTGPVMFENDMVVWEIIRWKIAPAAYFKPYVAVLLETRNPKGMMCWRIWPKSGQCKFSL